MPAGWPVHACVLCLPVPPCKQLALLLNICPLPPTIHPPHSPLQGTGSGDEAEDISFVGDLEGVDCEAAAASRLKEISYWDQYGAFHAVGCACVCMCRFWGGG